MLAYLVQCRRNFDALVSSMTLEELNHIPTGYSNNIFWNYAHNVVTQQLLCYALAGQKMMMSEEDVNEFRKGAKPSREYTQEDFDRIKSFASSTIEQLEKDLKTDMFSGYKEYTTSFNVTLSSIDDAVSFNNIHEGLHFGYAMAMRKVVKNEMNV